MKDVSDNSATTSKIVCVMASHRSETRYRMYEQAGRHHVGSVSAVGRTFSALRFAASCAGPGRHRWMASLCLMSCSSSFLILSSSL